MSSSLNASAPSVASVSEFVVTKIELMKQTQSAIKRGALLGGFVPDYILRDHNFTVPSLRKLNAVVFMTDISGFTALTEAYSLKGKGGTDMLTKTLTNYMTQLAECILRIEGDIIKYAGDAFLSLWEIHDNTSVPELIQKVTDCALYCQEKCGSYVTDVGITIRVKIGIGVGVCYSAGLGDQSYHHWAVFGPGVYAASEAEHTCESGDVVLHPSAWGYCDPENFTFTNKEKEHVFIKVTDILHFLDPSKRGRPIVSQRMKSSTTKNKINLVDGHLDEIRPQLDEVFLNASETRLRKFVIPPVLKKLDNETPLVYLNESRMVSIVFIHVDYGKIEYTDENYGVNLLSIVQHSFTAIHTLATNLNGCLSKVIMFDKGLTYLVVFGLPGYIQDNQVGNSLNFAYRIKKYLSNIHGVKHTSIGCTTGSTYCGVLGHPRRQEYTVIGRKVNKAARLMIYYPETVTCDQDTFYSSRLPAHYFRQLEAKALKGISNVGQIFEYLSSDSGDERAVRKFEYPILDRRSDMETIERCLRTRFQEYKTNLMSTRGLGSLSALDQSLVSSSQSIIVLEGENGIGKSRMLAEVIKVAETSKWNVFSIALTQEHVSLSLFAVAAVLVQAFNLEGKRTPAEREEHLRDLAIQSGDSDIISGLSTLNDIFQLKTPAPPKFANNFDAKSRDSFAHHTIKQLITDVFSDKMVLFCIDDAHFMHQLSWEYFNHISKMCPNVMTVMTLRRNSDGGPKIPDVAYTIVYHSLHVQTIQLKGLPENYILPLACQLLEVRGIPDELERILTSKSRGNPSWVEDVLNDLILQGKVKIIKSSPNSEDKSSRISKDIKMNFVVVKYITRESGRKPAMSAIQMSTVLDGDDDTTATLVKDKMSEDFTQRKRENPEKRLCLISSNTNINSSSLSSGRKELVLDAFDSLNSNDQMVVKCASVLGRRFSRMMLHRLLPSFGKEGRKYLSCFQRLMENRIFQCATTAKRNSTTAIECQCLVGQSFTTFFTSDGQDDLTKLNLPKYAYCRYTEFYKENMVEVVYGLLTEDLRKDLHLKAATYYETTTIQCLSCGGSDTSYTYGFVLNRAEIMGEREEDAIVGSMNKKKRINLTSDQSVRNLHKMKPFISGISVNSDTLEPDSNASSQSNRQHMSLTTRINSLRKAFENNGGSQLAGIEMDILNSLVHYDEVWELRHWFRCCRKNKLTALKESISKRSTQYESGRFVQKLVGGVRNSPKLIKLRSKTKSLERAGLSGATTLSSGFTDESKFELFDEDEGDSELFDFRGCECTAIQAMIFIELIDHYRKAGKIGKCIMHSLEAAETSVSVGNNNQALSYIEDVKKLKDDIDDGILEGPKPEDHDDVIVIDREFDRRINFLQGLTFFEIGAVAKAKGFFMKCLQLLGTVLPEANQTQKIKCNIKLANLKLWRLYNAPRCFQMKLNYHEGDDVSVVFTMKNRSFSYLRRILEYEGHPSLALLVSLRQVMLVMESGDQIHDRIPAYCNMLEMYTHLGNHKRARFYEKLSMEVMKLSLGLDEQMNPVGLLSSANLFLSLADARLARGELDLSCEACYLVLRLCKLLHDNDLACHIYPTLIKALMFSLKVNDAAEAVHNLGFSAQADNYWLGTAWYYSLVLEFILELGCQIESFYCCEQFVAGNKWDADMNLFSEKDLQFTFETGIALWYTRMSRWEIAKDWIRRAESHVTDSSTLLSVQGSLRLMECYLIRANYHQNKKRYKLLAIDNKEIREITVKLRQKIKATPIFAPRYYHLLAYSCRILDHKKEAESYLRRSAAIAAQNNNQLELEWVKHSRLVWASMAIPSVKYYWVQHAEHPVKLNDMNGVPWANILFSLPLPAWT